MLITRHTTLGRLYGWLANVCPRLAYSGQTHGHQTDVVSFGQLVQGSWWGLFSLFTNLSNRLFSELRQVLFFAVGFSLSAFLLHVVNIGLVVTQEQMSRSNARSVVATMEDQLIFGDGPVLEFPGNAMGGEVRMGFSLFIVGANEAITFRADTSSPYPTLSFHVGQFWSMLTNSSPKPRRRGHPLAFQRSAYTHKGSLT